MNLTAKSYPLSSDSWIPVIRVNGIETKISGVYYSTAKEARDAAKSVIDVIRTSNPKSDDAT